jgi:hypothetical protein
VKDAIEKNHVVIQNMSDEENELLTGATKAEHLVPMFTFLEDVEANKESKLQITVFSKNGKPTTSELHFINKDKSIFKNKNRTYTMPTGEIPCASILGTNRSLIAQGCKGDHSTVLIIPFSMKEYNLANVEYKKLKN